MFDFQPFLNSNFLSVVNNMTINMSKFLLHFTNHVWVTAEGSKIERCAPTTVSMSGGCTSVHQLFDKLELSFETSPAECG